MTARAFTVDRTGRKHEVRRKRQSARERLVAYYHNGVGCWERKCTGCRHFHDLLRAHERELAERAAIAVHDYEDETGILFDVDIKAAILARPRRERSGR